MELINDRITIDVGALLVPVREARATALLRVVGSEIRALLSIWRGR